MEKFLEEAAFRIEAVFSLAHFTCWSKWSQMVIRNEKEIEDPLMVLKVLKHN